MKSNSNKKNKFIKSTKNFLLKVNWIVLENLKKAFILQVMIHTQCHLWLKIWFIAMIGEIYHKKIKLKNNYLISVNLKKKNNIVR
jgi:predicted SprT family Zn-dependent metalloprotease